MSDNKGEAFTKLGTMDHIGAILRNHKAGKTPTARIKTDEIKRYLTQLTQDPSPHELETYECLLNHPFIDLLVQMCKKAELSDVPYPFGRLIKSHGMFWYFSHA